MLITNWGLATSNSEATVTDYNTTIKKPDGQTNTAVDLSPHMWSGLEEKELAQAAWARCFATKRSQSLEVTATRNSRKFQLFLYRAPEDTQIVSFSLWGAVQPEVLTDREHDVVSELIAGYTLREAAERLGISVSTANKHRTAAMQKLNVKTEAQLGAMYARRQ